jgi:TRAP-type C4-dicarboxylate transport system permease small subunit
MQQEEAAGQGAPRRAARYGVLEAMLGLLLALLSTVVIAQVALRYLLDQPLAWTEEAARFLFIWSCMLGAAVACKRGQQFGVDYFTRTVQGKAGRWLRLVLKLIELAYYVVLTWAGIVVTLVAVDQRLPLSRFSMSYAYAALPIATGLMCLFALGQAWRELNSKAA